MKTLPLLLSLAGILLGSSVAHAAPLLTFDYTFSFVLKTANKTAGNDDNPTVTGDITLTERSGAATSFDATSLTLNAFTLPIDANPADNLSVPSFTITSAASTLSGTVFTLATPSTGVITTQGTAYTSAGDVLKDASGNSYLFGLSNSATASDVAWTLNGSTGGTYFSSTKVTYTAAAVPEPSSYVLALLAAGGFVYLRRRAARG
jgi:hypothetical protein